MNSAEKFTDMDVYRHPYLEHVARDYALAYVGGFEFMRNARAMAETVGELTRGVTRGVLNCMRLDPLVAGSLPEPLKVAPVVLDRPPLRSVPDPAQPPARAEYVDLRSYLNWPWVYSTHPFTKNAHIARPTDSVLRYFPGSEDEQAVYRYKIHTWCGNIPSRSFGEVAPLCPDHLRPCVICVHAQEVVIRRENSDDREHQDQA